MKSEEDFGEVGKPDSNKQGQRIGQNQQEQGMYENFTIKKKKSLNNNLKKT